VERSRGRRKKRFFEFGHTQTKAPQTRLSHRTLVEQPSPEVCSHPPYVLTCNVGMARTGYHGKSENIYRSLEKSRPEISQALSYGAGLPLAVKS
jgi:hypothetical protein